MVIVCIRIKNMPKPRFKVATSKCSICEEPVWKDRKIPEEDNTFICVECKNNKDGITKVD